MKFTLKDYQEDAVQEILNRLRKARRRWHEDKDKHAFSLTATTGAGKTVMAAAVFEALFYGNDDSDFEPDSGAVVIWFSDDPSLNQQSLWRLREASDRLTISNLVTVDNNFGREKFEAGKVYFLNTQKLSKNSLLVRGHDPNDAELESVGGSKLMPDLRSHTIWDTIQNTIEDPELTLYLVLDEAHRGMKESRGNGDGRTTIVKQLINGAGSVPGIPIVWGISATVDRFNQAMEGMRGHSKMPNVIVDSRKVQESGLLKDVINIDIPEETGDFSTVLVRRATDKLRDISKAWAAYAAQQGVVDTVRPLMVLQVPNSPDHKTIGEWLDIILERWTDVPTDGVGNVFGEHKTETFGRHTARYVEPERVQDSDWVRILVAKDAISTGWDCPRAEVMVSFRAASDKTHITQLLGRMVRSPLARRIPGNDRLNAVDCLLPYFDRKAVDAVVAVLMGRGAAGEELPGRRVLINPREMSSNLAIPETVWDKLLSLPSQAMPKRQAKPVKRLTTLAQELADDGLLPDAGKKAHSELHKVLDGALARYAEELTKARQAVLIVEGKTVKADINTKGMSFDDFVEAADYAVIDEAYRRAARIIGPDLARTYSEHLAERATRDDEEALVEAHIAVAAIGLLPEIKDDLEAAAEDLSNKWLEKYRITIRGLPDERQEIYRQLRESSTDPLDIDLARPKTWLQETTIKEPDGTEVPLPQYEKHLLCDENGLFPEHFTSSWEPDVLRTELKREGTIAWYRNPSRASHDSLGVTYEDAGVTKIIRPDFIFFAKLPNGTIAADIVDPHGTHFAEALPKLKGLARYAEHHGAHFRRIEAVAKIGDSYRVLDLTEPRTRGAIMVATSIRDLYGGQSALDYEIVT